MSLKIEIIDDFLLKDDLQLFGKTLALVGLILLCLGALIWFWESQGWSYKNPLDFRWEKGHTRIYFPLGTSLLVSLVLSVLFYVLKK